MRPKFFVYTGEDMEFHHETEEQAKASAEEALDMWRKLAIADGEWPEEAEAVCWGRVAQAVAGPSEDSDYGDSDYGLTDISAGDESRDLIRTVPFTIGVGSRRVVLHTVAQSDADQLGNALNYLQNN